MDIIVSILAYNPLLWIILYLFGGFAIPKLSLHSAADTQIALCQWLKSQRKTLKLSRKDLAERSTVPPATIKRFETTGQISLRQFILLWQSVDDIGRLHNLTLPQPPTPKSINEVLAINGKN